MYDSGCEVGKKMPQVTEAVTDIQNAVRALDDSIEQLSGRLSVVLLPDTPRPPTTECVKEQIKVPLAGELSGITEKIRSFHYRVESLLTRLEV